MKVYIKIILILSIMQITLGAQNMDEKLYNVSIIELIANEKKYDKKNIILIGFAHVSFENNALYLSSLDSVHSISKNAIWLSLDRIQSNKFSKNNKKYCIIEGVYNSQRKGHLGMYSGTIENITRFDIWE